MGNDKQGDDGEDCAMTYQEYCNDLKRFNQPITMDEKEWKIKYCIQEEYTPLLARKSSSHKNIEPTLSNHSKGSSKPQLKINLLDIPKPDNFGLVSELDARIAEKKTKKVKPLTRKPNQVERVSFKNMTDEEIKAHKRKLNQERRLKAKQDGTLRVLSDEEIAKQREYARKYYHDNRDVQLAKQNTRRKNMTEEQKDKVKAEGSKWQDANRDHVNAKAREWKKNNRIKKQGLLNEN